MMWKPFCATSLAFSDEIQTLGNRCQPCGSPDLLKSLQDVGVVGQREVVVQHLFLPHYWRLARSLDRAMRQVGEAREGVVEAQPGRVQVQLRLLVSVVARHVDLVTTSADHVRREQIREGREDASRPTRDARVREAQLARGGLIRV